MEITTLDTLTKKFGIPDFIKINVEGFEYQVMKGLTQPVSCLSFEFVPEFLKVAYRCIDYLRTLGSYCMNYSLGESMSLTLAEWIPPMKLKEIISNYKNDITVFGDIYSRHE